MLKSGLPLQILIYNKVLKEMETENQLQFNLNTQGSKKKKLNLKSKFFSRKSPINTTLEKKDKNLLALIEKFQTSVLEEKIVNLIFIINSIGFILIFLSRSIHAFLISKKSQVYQLFYNSSTKSWLNVPTPLFYLAYLTIFVVIIILAFRATEFKNKNVLLIIRLILAFNLVFISISFLEVFSLIN